MKLLMSQYFIACFSDQDRMFPLSAVFSVFRIDRPFIVRIDHNACFADIDHRLDRDHHARNKDHACPALADVANKGIFVEFDSHTVSAEFTYNRITF